MGGVLDQLTGYRESQMPDPTQLDLTYDFILRTEARRLHENRLVGEQPARLW